MGLFPCGETRAFGYPCRPCKDAAEEPSGRVKSARHGAQSEGLEMSPVTCSAPVTVELELEAPLCAQVAVIPGKADLLRHVLALFQLSTRTSIALSI